MSFALRKSGAKPATPRIEPASIFAIASGKGGVGKTWLSTTLANCFARMGKRTLLIDGDLGCANVDVSTGHRSRNRPRRCRGGLG